MMTETECIPAMEWPYPIRYGEEKEVSADVLILGGGIAGCHAAINAAKRRMGLLYLLPRLFRNW